MQDLIAEIKREFPKFSIVKKQDSKLMRTIAVFLRILTFGQATDFMSRFHTTIGYTLYVSSSWDSMPNQGKMVVLRHERVHMRQAAAYGLLLFSFLYLFFPLPFILAYFRMKFEREAYEESMRATLELYPGGISILTRPFYKERMVRHFTSAEYFWMWPFKRSVEKWFDGYLLHLKTKVVPLQTESW